MRLPRVRFTVRQLMVLVAIAWLGAWLVTMRRPRVRFTVRGLAIAAAMVALAVSLGIWLTRMGRLAGIYQERPSACGGRKESSTRGRRRIGPYREHCKIPREEPDVPTP